MSSTASQPKISDEKRRRLVLGELPEDFLRIDSTSTPDTDQQIAAALDSQYNAPMMIGPIGRLNITVDQAKLVKNYGLVRMDPYVRLRVGHSVYETQSATNGGKNPRWNKDVQCWLPSGVNRINLEIYDECSFTTDELIAWAQITIPATVFNGNTHEEWYPLDGKLGQGQEGAINLVMSFVPASALPPSSFSIPAARPVMMVPRTGSTMYGCNAYTPVPVYQAPTPVFRAPQSTPSVKPSTEEDVKMVQEMFPDLDKEVIISVFAINHNDKDATINSLLQMSR